MIGLKRTILGISDLKTLFQSIRAKYAIDFSNYALSSLKRRIEEFMFSYHFSDIDELIHKIENDESFFLLLEKGLLVDTTEMFRDPEFWEELKNHVLKKYRNKGEIKIWIPDSNSGEDLYTILIVLERLNLNEKVQLCLTSTSLQNISPILNASFDMRKMEANIANFERYEEGAQIQDYFITKANALKLNQELIENANVIQHRLFKDKIPGIFDLIIFRNKMLYFNQQLKIQALKILNSALKPGGCIAVGIKETLNYPGWDQEFTLISESERIYKKTVS